MRQRLPSRPPIESTAAGLTSTEASRPCGKTQVNHLKAGDGLSITLASWAFHSMRICVDVLDADGMESESFRTLELQRYVLPPVTRGRRWPFLVAKLN
jgi:hypothetical protein